MRWTALIALVGLSGCSSAPAQESFEFGEIEMRNSVTGTWSGSWTHSSSKVTAFDLKLEQGTSQLQPQCGNRTFVKPACVSMSGLTLSGTLTTADGTFTAAAVTGSFDVMGTKMNNGTLMIKTATGWSFEAQYDGTIFSNGRVYGENRTDGGTFTMSRK